jgi:hypothetical protein
LPEFVPETLSGSLSNLVALGDGLVAQRSQVFVRSAY